MDYEEWFVFWLGAHHVAKIADCHVVVAGDEMIAIDGGLYG